MNFEQIEVEQDEIAEEPSEEVVIEPDTYFDDFPNEIKVSIIDETGETSTDFPAPKSRSKRQQQQRPKKRKASPANANSIKIAEQEYARGVNIFSIKCITEFREAAETLLCKEDMPDNLVSSLVPDHAPMRGRSATFLVDLRELEHPKEIYLDEHGSWGKPWQTNAFYNYCTDDTAERVDMGGEKGSFINHITQTELTDPEKFDAKIVKVRYRHPNADGKLSKYIFVVRDPEECLKRWAMVSYKWETQPFHFAPLPRQETKFLDTLQLDSSAQGFAETQQEEVHEDFGPGVNIFRKKCIGEFKPAAEILLLTEDAAEGTVCQVVPPRAPLKLQEVAFLVDLRALKNPRDVFADSHGHWGKSSGLAAFYAYQGDTVERVDSDGKVSKFNDLWDAKILKVRYRHPDTNKKLMKHIYTARDRDGQLLRWALVSYKWNRCPPYEFTHSKERGMDYSSEMQNQMRRIMPPEEYETRLRELRGEGEADANSPPRGQDLWPQEEAEQEFADGVALFGTKAITEFRDAVDILFKLDLDNLPTCAVVPQGASLKRMETTFVVDLMALDTPTHIFQDSHGSWGKPHGGSVFYKCSEEFVERLGTDSNVDYNTKITKGRYKHSNAGNHLCKYIFTCRSAKGKLYRWALVAYKWMDGEPFPFQPGPPCRGTHPAKQKRRSRLDTPGTSLAASDVDIIEDEFCATVAHLVEDARHVQEHEAESDVIDPEERFPPGVVPFSPQLVTTFADAAEIMIRKVASGPVCTVVPPSAPLKMKTITYLVDLQALADPRDLFVDLHGSWGKCSGMTSFYRYNAWGVTKVDSEGHIKGPDQSYDVKMNKHRYRHTQVKLKLKKFVFSAQNPVDEYLRWAIISYQWDCDPFTFQPAPHGNSRKNVPYQPTKPSARNRMKELALLYTPQKAISEYLNEKGEELAVSEPHEIPRDVRQAANLGRFPRSIHRAAANIAKNADTTIRQFPTRDYIYAVLDETLKDSVFSYTVTKHSDGEYSCICEEFKTCFICRHSLAVAKLNDEAKMFIDTVATRIKDPTSYEDIPGHHLTTVVPAAKKRGRPPKKRRIQQEATESRQMADDADDGKQISSGGASGTPGGRGSWRRKGLRDREVKKERK